MIRLSIVRDISERKRAEESLLEAQEQFRVLSESALVGVYLIQDNVFRYVNPAAARMYGYAVDEIVGRSATALAHPDDRALIAENLPRRLEGEVEEARYQLRGFRKDGSVFPVEVHGRRIVLGGKVAVLGAVMGISERKRAERRLLAQHEVTRALAEPRTLEEAAPRPPGDRRGPGLGRRRVVSAGTGAGRATSGGALARRRPRRLPVARRVAMTLTSWRCISRARRKPEGLDQNLCRMRPQMYRPTKS